MQGSPPCGQPLLHMTAQHGKPMPWLTGERGLIQPQQQDRRMRAGAGNMPFIRQHPGQPRHTRLQKAQMLGIRRHAVLDGQRRQHRIAHAQPPFHLGAVHARRQHDGQHLDGRLPARQRHIPEQGRKVRGLPTGAPDLHLPPVNAQGKRRRGRFHGPRAQHGRERILPQPGRHAGLFRYRRMPRMTERPQAGDGGVLSEQQSRENGQHHQQAAADGRRLVSFTRHAAPPRVLPTV